MKSFQLEFRISFSLAGCWTKAKKPKLPNYFPVENIWINAFPKGIGAK